MSPDLARHGYEKRGRSWVRYVDPPEQAVEWFRVVLSPGRRPGWILCVSYVGERGSRGARELLRGRFDSLEKALTCPSLLAMDAAAAMGAPLPALARLLEGCR